MMGRILSIMLFASLWGCSGADVYRAYLGEPLSPMQASTIHGQTFFRQDLINRYVDAVRFLQVDGVNIDQSMKQVALEVNPGFHEIKVYFQWDMGNGRGLAPALVSYAANRDTMSRNLRFNALPGEKYTVLAEPYFSDTPRDITTLSHVDFWVEDSRGIAVVSRAQGAYFPGR